MQKSFSRPIGTPYWDSNIKYQIPTVPTYTSVIIENHNFILGHYPCPRSNPMWSSFKNNTKSEMPCSKFKFQGQIAHALGMIMDEKVKVIHCLEFAVDGYTRESIDQG